MSIRQLTNIEEMIGKTIKNVSEPEEVIITFTDKTFIVFRSGFCNQVDVETFDIVNKAHINYFIKHGVIESEEDLK